MSWDGGVQGAGKSTVAQVLATAYDLPVHHVDAFTYVHLDRTAPAPSLDEQLALGPVAAADSWDRIIDERLSLVVEDVEARGLAPVPAVVERLSAREAVVVGRLRDDLDRTGRPWREVADEPDWDGVRRWVEETLDLGSVPRLEPGPGLAAQRRYENDAIATQVRLWRTAAGLTDPLVLDFACECGQSGCRELWRGTYLEYEERRRSTKGIGSPSSR